MTPSVTDSKSTVFGLFLPVLYIRVKKIVKLALFYIACVAATILNLPFFILGTTFALTMPHHVGRAANRIRELWEATPAYLAVGIGLVTIASGVLWIQVSIAASSLFLGAAFMHHWGYIAGENQQRTSATESD